MSADPDMTVPMNDVTKPYVDEHYPCGGQIIGKPDNSVIEVDGQKVVARPYYTVQELEDGSITHNLSPQLCFGTDLQIGDYGNLEWNSRGQYYGVMFRKPRHP